MRRLRPYPASPEIKEKIENRHGVAFREVEEVFRKRPLVIGGERDQYGERRYVALGETDRSRRLMAAFTIPGPGWAKVITARDMVSRERKLYKRKKRR